ncbi:Chromatin structure-remodeling complex subunit [Wickerhamomyces ciferrii]|uniref:Chromatin structure-remodeling complex subunit n=1 Tax=Wickerhamomyces ciferrii (strain ATCC 14091 / BCRC 22168 / CBS 111 / JCM 3599 / NBRC 0793 / NRRL Y-1031 F-60-10) TaxID=1206466 RepID=K0K7J8_WICCF|nr:Chromatin structure-remodeling complex subunit [Wickerhamomyces ciferrii]CCH40770.1 Chromatin structure-remodeling complex subunit [Wickerhamomyces ciferrii]
MEKPLLPQGLSTNFHNRVKNDQTALYISAAPTRSTKRAKNVVNYAEYEDLNFDDENDTNYADDGYNNYNSLASVNNTDSALNNTLQGKLAVKTKHLNFSEYEMNFNSLNEEILIPIRINLEHNSNRIVDFFMWNLNETLITPEQFALITCQDMDLPNSYQSQIANSIKSQIEEYTNLVTIQLPKNIDIHVVIELSCNLDKNLYEDKVEWDLTNDAITPEAFARYVVMDLGLSLEFLPAIAHTLHESILKLKKDCIDGRLPQEIYNQSAFGYEAGVRLDHERLGASWVPSVEELSQWEIEKREIEKERNIRRLKRESMRIDDGSNKRRSYRRRYDDLEIR